MIPYSIRKEQVLQELQVEEKKGLSNPEVEERQKKYGLNKLTAKKQKSILVRFLEQFKDVMILILLAAAVISFVVALNGHDKMEFFEPLLIVLIVVLNAIMGVAQESKARKALDALKKLSAPHARVLRGGVEEVIDASLLVPGDIILLEAGDYVPADARLLEAASLKAEESALTGESLPSEKESDLEVAEKAPIGDRSNMVYAGCSITYGRGKAVVTGTGMNTEMGKIANLLEQAEESITPLQKKLATLGKYLGFMAVGICIIIFIIGLLADLKLVEIFMTSVSLAVSAIPEGLPAIVTIVLSIGVQRMVKKNAIIKSLPAVETLGSASIICSDKTGTLTQNKMTLLKAYSEADQQVVDITDNNNEITRQLLTYATLCCDGSVTFENGEEKHLGDPTETSIVYAAYRNKLIKEELNKQYPRVAEVPFDSDRKLMSVVNEIDGKLVVIAKGGIDTLAGRCTSGDIDAAKAVAEELGKDALRVLAVAYKVIEKLPDEITSESLEYDLTLMGLVGMIDPPREEAKEAVKICRKAGIKPVMITGDHVITASAIAKQLGILTEADKAITGQELAAMSDEELRGQVRSIAVYARVSPEDKIRIVRAWQTQEEIVSMTGDGVNDAPALKAADIGCAMGITGTDVAKGAADMTLTDDNFATIVDAVREGRGIYDNIRKTVGFLLGTNIGEVITVFVAMLLWQQTPLLSMQLLWINLVTDSLPAVALGMEAVDPNIMHRKPRPKKEGIFAHGLGTRIVLQGTMFGILSLFAFFYGCGFEVHGATEAVLKEGRTMAFIVLSLSQVVHSFNMRSNKSLFKIGPFSNHMLNGAALLSTILVVLILFVKPLAMIFGLASLSLTQYVVAFSLAFVPLVVLEIAKVFGIEKEE